jgi:hypothetical protein
MTDDELEASMWSTAAAALRRRAERQRGTAKTHGDRAGETAIAGRIADVLDELADDFSREALPPIT